MNGSADLHIHTYYSDSTSSPQEVIDQAIKSELNCIAITDHDTIDGVIPTMEAAKGTDLEVIAGIELSTDQDGKDIHVLGYLFDYKNEELINYLKSVQNSRVERMKQMIMKLKDLGIDSIELEEVCALTESDAVGRPHLAKILVDKGVVTNIKRAFDLYLAEGAPAYVSKFKQSPYEAIELIKRFGGVSVLAHPMSTNVDQLIPGFAKAGLDGLEVYYPNNANNITSFYENLAKKYNLLMTGGSDAHGKAKRNTYVGRIKIDYALVEKLKQAAGK